jgi:hypothetical protein
LQAQPLGTFVPLELAGHATADHHQTCTTNK